MIYRSVLPPIDEGGYELSPARSIFALVVPEATVNIVTNPECIDLVGYTDLGSTMLASDASKQRRGIRSLRCTYGGSGEFGVYYTLPADLGEGYHTFSVDVFGRGEFGLWFGDENGVPLDDSMVRLAGVWSRPSLTTYSSGEGVRTVGVKSYGTESFWVDGFQVEQKEYATTFVSGNIQSDRDTAKPGRPMYGWHGWPHRSASYRTAQAKNGGRIVYLSDVGLKVTGFSGLGLNVPELATVRLMNGMGILDSVREVDRQFTITGVIQASDLLDLTSMRSNIVSIISGGQATPAPVLMLMQMFDDDGEALTERVTIRCIYAGGMEGAISNVIGEQATLSFSAWSGPQTDGNLAKSLLYERASTWSAIRAIYPDKTVDALPGGESWDTETLPFRIAVGQDLSLYACRGSRLVKWFEDEWVVVADIANRTVVDVCAGPDGAIWFAALDDDGGDDCLVYRYFPYAGVVPVHVVTLIRAGSGDIVLGRIRSDPVKNRVYFVGNFSSAQLPNLTYPAGDYGKFNQICFYDCRNSRWGDFPSLEPNNDADYIVYDVDVDVLGSPWIVGEFKLKGLRPEAGARNGWGIANFNLSTRQWEAQGDWCLVNAIEASALTPWDVEVTSVKQLGGRVIRFDVNRFNPMIGGRFNIAFMYDDSIDYGLGSSLYPRRWFYLNNITEVDWVSGYPKRIGECPNSNIVPPPPPPGFPSGWRLPSESVGIMPWVTDADTGAVVPSFVDDIVPYADGMHISGGFTQPYYIVEERRCGFLALSPGAQQPQVSPGLIRYSRADAQFHKAGIAGLTKLSGYTYYDPWTDATKGPYALPAYGCGIAIVNLDPAVSSNVYSAQPPTQSSWADAAGWTPSGTFYVSHRPSNGMFRAPGPVSVPISIGARLSNARIEVTGPCTLGGITNRTTGYSVAPEMEVAPGETIIFFLSESRIVSTTRGEIRYTNMATDDFPNLGMEPGANEIVAILDADDPGGSASLFLCWSEEFSSMDMAILHGRS